MIGMLYIAIAAVIGLAIATFLLSILVDSYLCSQFKYIANLCMCLSAVQVHNSS